MSAEEQRNSEAPAEASTEASAEPSTEASAEVDEEARIIEVRLERCEGLIQNHTLGAVAIGFLPVPVLDMAALVALQFNLLRGLGEVYGQPLSESLARSLIASLVGGVLPLSSASLLKTIPVVGLLIASVSAPVLTGGSTYALGRVFVLHFESGGTFLSLDPDKVRAHYEAEFVRGQAMVRERAFRGVKP